MTLRTEINLDDFVLRDLDPGADPGAVASQPDEDWVPAVVPGGVRESLLAAGRMADPFYGDNERVDAWIDDRDWWYRLRFSRPEQPADRVRLVFDGLDTVADVWLNGTHLGHHENQFRPAEFDVTALLADDNTVLVRFTPPLDGREVPDSVAQTMGRLMALFEAAGEGLSEGEGMLAALPRATTLRKAAFSWGWDFGPNVPSIGIWRPARLSLDTAAVISGHHVALTSLADDHTAAQVRVRVETERITADAALAAQVRLTAPSGRQFAGLIDLGPDGAGEVVLDIDDPELWWTQDLGDQALHEVEITLTAHGAEADIVRDRVGLRSLVLDQRPDEVEGGRLFRFVLNGVPLFIRGAAWLPASTLVGSVSPDTYQDRVQRAREGNLNMLRVWGGGIYEHDAFYTACDELGVLVWQDFMFACIDYPSEDRTLQREVTLEAEYQVRRLRNRASLALWAGNNEVHTIHVTAWMSLDPGNWGSQFFHEILPGAVHQHDGLTPYWPGSPYGEGNGIFSINGTDDGDRHTWEVWHGMVVPGLTIGPDEYPTVGDARHYRRYAYDTAKFVSEFGIHAAPELATLRRWIPEDQLQVHSATFDLHNKDNPKNKGDELLSVTTGLPQSLEEYVAFTQAVQAEGMAFAIEHYRRRQPHTSGALIWQYGDVWPGFSWSIIDYDGVPKASYYTAARASAPVAGSFLATEGGGLELWIANNTRETAELDLEVEIGVFGGTDRHTVPVHASVAPSTSQRVWTAEPDTVVQDGRHYAWASAADGSMPAVRKHFAEIADLELGESRLDVTVEGAALRIRSTGHSYMVRIEQPLPGMRLSDNCFDLRDGDEVLIHVTGADPATLAVATYPHS
ncbi:glycosyl hydrolase 2 galactose-binding domain-containing protein [Plantibacter sp. Mn2098]|uniref:glycoside hydrolase family 2 protein n=1 Tax=Plantibacter sp. Mn2098 TaxID=3395266 RepID=UPI003BE32442